MTSLLNRPYKNYLLVDSGENTWSMYGDEKIIMGVQTFHHKMTNKQ